jgi:hypothetical protein
VPRALRLQQRKSHARRRHYRQAEPLPRRPAPPQYDVGARTSLGTGGREDKRCAVNHRRSTPAARYRQRPRRRSKARGCGRVDFSLPEQACCRMYEIRGDRRCST